MAEKKFYVVKHFREVEIGGVDVKFIGIFSSKDLADDAIQNHKKLNGFIDYPNGFRVKVYNLSDDTKFDVDLISKGTVDRSLEGYSYKLYLLMHRYVYDGIYEDVKMLGIFNSIYLAEESLKNFVSMQDFEILVDGLVIEVMTLNKIAS